MATSQPTAWPKENGTAKEAAAWLGISERTIWERIDEIPHFRVGRQVRFNLEELRRWAKARSNV